MEFHWIYPETQPLQIKAFLSKQGISKKMLAKIKFQGGTITVNGQEENVLYQLQPQDQLTIQIPQEKPHELLQADDLPLSIVFEDEHLLVVNKPAGVPSIPAQYHPNGTMANRVKYYLCAQNYENQVVHIVTRLDKDTSGLMIFAKHGFAHAKLDQQLREKQLIKKYAALVSGNHLKLPLHDVICQPIARAKDSIMKRTVDPEGKDAKTEYWVKKQLPEASLVEIQLHTGRTHQIRVHFEFLGCPLLGDDLYGAEPSDLMDRQALHCQELFLVHPFTEERLHFTAPLPEDMAAVLH